MKLHRRLLLAAAAALASGGQRARSETLPGLQRQVPNAAAPPPNALPTGDHEIVELWPGDPPGGGGPVFGERRFEETQAGVVTRVARPCLLVLRPDKPNGAAMLVAPGGGYLRIDVGHEGIPVATWLAQAGITAFVLVYRLPGEGWKEGADAPRQDAQRAIRLIRNGAIVPGLDPERIGVIGFSAGGHLMGEASVGWDDELYEAVDASDAVTARPTLSGMIYAVVTMLAPYDRTISSRRVLLGNTPSDAERIAYSVDAQVDANTPPVFLAQAADDTIAIVDHPLLMYTALRKAKIPAELHLFERGGHGFGLGVPGTPAAAWPSLFLAWARRHNFLRT